MCLSIMKNFCFTKYVMQIETCRKVENVLKRIDRKGSMIRVLPFHAALDHETRLANMEEFRGSQMKDSASFLVCTDRCSFNSLSSRYVLFLKFQIY